MNSRKILFILSLVSLYGLNLLGQNFTRHTITTSFILSKKLDVADIDRDGDLDIAAAANDTTTKATPVMVAWFENDGDQNFTQHNLDTNFPGARVAIAADLIPGGYLEVVAGNLGTDAIRMYEYDSQFGTWSTTGIGTSAQYNFSVRAADVDEDGDLDLLATYGPTQNIITWFENNGSGSFTEHQITSTYINAADAELGDVDGDDILDIFGIAFIGPPNIPNAENVNWWKGDGTPANGGWTNFLVDQHPGWPNDLDLVDLDQDNDLDAIVATWFGESVTWYKNDGSGNFTQQPDVVNNFARARSSIAEDVDGDGYLDIVAAADADNEVSWFENDGSQNWTPHIISTTVDYAYFAYPVDLEGDGDIDVATSAQDGNEVAWWENDLDDDQILASGSIAPTSFWNGNVTIDFTTNPTSGLVTVFYNAGSTPDANLLESGIDHIAQKGYYTITTKKTGYTAEIDFLYGAGNVNEWSAITDPNDLVICLWDEGNSQWTEAGTSQSVDDINQTVTVFGLTDGLQPFSKWTLGSKTADNPLPVQLLAFTANSIKDGIQLQWSTASEINNLGFEIWRSERVDSGYVLQGSYLTDNELQGAGNSNQTIEYQFVDIHVQENATYYYQLVDVDFNNVKTYHGPIEITYSTEALFAVRTYRLQQNFPNPFNGVTHIPVYIAGGNQAGNNSVRLAIYDITGQEVRNFNLTGIDQGLHMIEWDGKDQFRRTVSSGVYIYSLFADGKLQSKRLQFVK